MTQDEIIRMAREAGLGNERWTTDEQFHNFLERFTALVAAHEREACAKVCEENSDNWINRDCAAALRARSNHG